MKKNAIGVFDSGVGGLTVVAKLQEQLPAENIIYLGDTARVPYGTKSEETIRKFSLENAAFLVEKKVKCIVVACNTASAYAIYDLEKKYPHIPVIGMIEAGAKYVVEKKLKRIAVIGTSATIKSHAYRNAIAKLSPELLIYEKACPLFVPIVEEALLSGKLTQDIIEHYLSDFRTKKIDAFLLGCTHYPLLKKELSQLFPKISLLDSAEAAAQYLKLKLTSMKLLNDRGDAFLHCYLTSPTDTFKRIAKHCLIREMNELSYIST